MIAILITEENSFVDKQRLHQDMGQRQAALTGRKARHSAPSCHKQGAETCEPPLKPIDKVPTAHYHRAGDQKQIEDNNPFCRDCLVPGSSSAQTANASKQASGLCTTSILAAAEALVQHIILFMKTIVLLCKTRIELHDLRHQVFMSTLTVRSAQDELLMAQQNLRRCRFAWPMQIILAHWGPQSGRKVGRQIRSSAPVYADQHTS